ncbi:hypothetical protein MCG45_15890 [Clostridium perfringens]|uniref:hypothetical protein n=1 Tax=Clostridium perfringens TaxID=1502 RepID=UPI001F0624D3|nr:hypothetical protein [Clostridium perfringens]MCH1964311.1 hypothetical protein [Clostridium perfringens]
MKKIELNDENFMFLFKYMLASKKELDKSIEDKKDELDKIDSIIQEMSQQLTKDELIKIVTSLL